MATQVNEKYFQKLLDQFYLRTIRNHPKKQFLRELKIKKINNSSILKSSSQEKQLISKTNTISLEPLNRSNISSRSRAYSAKSRDSSDDSKNSKIKVKNEEYFNCQWIYQSSSFVKSLIYAYLLLTAKVQNTELLIYLKDKFIEEYSDCFQKSQIHRIQFYWNKLIDCTFKKQKQWQKQFLDSFQHFSVEVSDKVFELTTKLNSQTMTLSKLTSETIKKISQSLGYGVNYFHINRKFIRAEMKEGQSLSFNLNIVYVQQLQRFMVSDKPLQKPSQDESSQKIKQTLGESIKKLLAKCNKDNSVLASLPSLMQYPSQKTLQSRGKVESRQKIDVPKPSKYSSLKAL